MTLCPPCPLVTVYANSAFQIHTHPDRDIFAPLASRLLILIKSLMTASAVNFVSPTTWPKHRDALSSVLPTDDDLVQAAYRTINTRNELLSSIRAPPAARQNLVKLLDSTLHAPVSDDLSARCWNMTKDPNALARTVLEWCTSAYRPGIAKVYVAHRLLSNWAGHGLDTTGTVLAFLVADPMSELVRKTALYHLVAELVRSGHFDPLRYIQWLIARGGLHDPNGVLPDGGAASRLLVELPISALPDSLRNMRGNMLGRASYNVEDEANDIDMAISCVKSTLGLHWPADANKGGLPLNKLCKRVNISSRALKSEIGYCLRQTVVPDLERGQVAGKEDLRFPTSTFIAVRSLLEAAEDFQTLAEFLRVALSLFDADILSSCADTLNLHLATFGALGIVRDLFEALVGKLGSLTQTQGLVAARPLLTSMAMLAPRMSGQEALVTYLNDTIRNDRTSAVDASSPVSDNMAARIQDEEGELLDEIEKRLANKTSMDRTTMNSFLNKIIPKIQSCWDKVDERLRAYGTLLTRLRHFDTQQFDSFMTKWVLGIRNPQSRPPLSQIFPLLVSVGCLNLSVILTTTSDAVSVTRPNMMAARPASMAPSTYVQEVLELLTAPPSAKGLLTADEIYRFQILQSQAPRAHFKEMVVLVRNALTEYCTSLAGRDATTVPLGKPRNQDRLIDLLRMLVLTDQAGVPKLLSLKSADPVVGRMMDDISTRLLLPTQPPGTQVAFEQVLGLANEFTLPFCHLKLCQGFAVAETSGTNPQERLQTQLEVFGKVMDDAVHSRNITWTSILPGLLPEVTQHLLSRAQTRLFELLPSTKHPSTDESSLSVAETLLSIIDAITRGGAAASRSAPLAPATVDRLTDLWELLASPTDSNIKSNILFKWLPLMITFLNLHCHSHDAANKQANEVRGRILIVLSGILQELEGLSSLALYDTANFSSNRVSYMSQRILDLTLIFVDNLSDEARQQCIRHLRDSLSESRLRYIFSYAPMPLENLMLLTKEKPATAAASHNGQAGQPPASRPRGTGFLGVVSLSQNAWGIPVPVGGIGSGAAGVGGEKLSAYNFRRWENLNEPTPIVGENDTSLSLTLFESIKLQ